MLQLKRYKNTRFISFKDKLVNPPFGDHPNHVFEKCFLFVWIIKKTRIPSVM